jgi:hypothetical protein
MSSTTAVLTESPICSVVANLNALRNVDKGSIDFSETNRILIAKFREMPANSLLRRTVDRFPNPSAKKVIEIADKYLRLLGSHCAITLDPDQLNADPYQARNRLEKDILEHISVETLEVTFCEAAQNGRDTIVEAMMDSNRFEDISADRLGEAFCLAGKHGKWAVVDQFMYNDRFKDISVDSISQVWCLAVIHGRDAVVEQLMTHARFAEHMMA